MNSNQEEIIEDNLINHEKQVETKDKKILRRKFTLKDFIQISGLTILSLTLSAIVIIVGLFLYYWTNVELVNNIGFWMILVGVVAFMLTSVVGFEKVD